MQCGEFGVKLSINIHLKLIHVATLTVLIKMFYTTIVRLQADYWMIL